MSIIGKKRTICRKSDMASRKYHYDGLQEVNHSCLFSLCTSYLEIIPTQISNATLEQFYWLRAD